MVQSITRHHSQDYNRNKLISQVQQLMYNKDKTIKNYYLICVWKVMKRVMDLYNSVRMMSDLLFFLIQMQYKFINRLGHFQIDLIELHESNYIEMHYQTGYVFFAYQPANHFMYLSFTKTKDTLKTSEILQDMMKYLDKYDQEFDSVIMDDGNEFRGEFTEILEEEKIKIRRINPNKDDHKILAPLNSMCRYVRSQILQKIVDMDKMGQQDDEKENKIMVTASQLNKIVKEIALHHNTKRLVKPYDKTPVDITVEEIEQFNELKLQHNYKVNDKFKFENGDIVRIKLHKDQLQKSRHKKYSDGVYEVVGRDLQHYYVKPCNFDSKRYKNYFQINDDIDSAPVYFRKGYEMREVDAQEAEKEKGYFPAEEKESNHYVFDKILATIPKNLQFDDIKKTTKYVIKVGNVQKVVSISDIRNDKFELSDSEKVYWFQSLYENVQIDEPIFRV
uniref:Uncharacterized protein n=1 Tax=Trepomonas sp. PC1 TaxID=1076344 RepID=A0A146K122_9EUKA|eukprot:JAP89625.1 Hypothetical protein TPC1_30880 [Trepomonas sp. PC1]